MKKIISLALLFLLAPVVLMAASTSSINSAASKVLVKKVFNNLAQVKTLTYNLSGQAQVSSLSQTAGQTYNSNTNLSVSGNSDFSNPQNLKSASRASLQIVYPDKNNQNQPATVSLSGEARMLSVDASYLKIDQLNLPTSALPIMALFADLNSQVVGKWLKINRQEVMNLADFSGKLKTNLNNLALEQKANQGKIASQARTIIINSGALRLTKKIGRENLNGIVVDHYQFTLDRAGLKKLYRDISVYRNSLNKKVLSKKELAQLDKDFENNIKVPVMPRGDLYIGVSDSLPYLITLNYKVSQSTKGSFDGSLRLDLSNYNQPVLVDTPTNATPIQTIFQQYFQQMTNKYRSGSAAF